MKVKHRDDELLGSEIVFVGQINAKFNFIFYYFLVIFEKLIFRSELTQLYDELPSSFLYKSYVQFKKQAVLFGNGSVLVKLGRNCFVQEAIVRKLLEFIIPAN